MLCLPLRRRERHLGWRGRVGFQAEQMVAGQNSFEPAAIVEPAFTVVGHEHYVHYFLVGWHVL